MLPRASSLVLHDVTVSLKKREVTVGNYAQNGLCEVLYSGSMSTDISLK